MSPLTYTIQKDPNARIFNVHVDHLKPYEGRNPPVNWLNLQEFDISEVSEISMVTEPDSDVSIEQAEAPVTPPRMTRAGRTIKPREIYSPV